MSIPKIKICGLTSLSDALTAARSGADYLGFIINFPKSPRHMSPEAVRKIIGAIKPNFPKIKFVGVLVNQDLSVAENLVSEIGLNVIQLHGSETPDYCATLRKKVEVWKALVIKSPEDLKNLADYQATADKILFDAGKGIGQEIDLTLLKNIAVDILAGGLGTYNVARAIQTVHPQIVDFNSALESAPGKKDVDKIRAAVAAVGIINQ